MRFLQFAASDFETKSELQDLSPDASFEEFLKEKFSIDEEMSEAILYALAFCVKPDGICFVPIWIGMLADIVRPYRCYCPSIE